MLLLGARWLLDPNTTPAASHTRFFTTVIAFQGFVVCLESIPVLWGTTALGPCGATLSQSAHFLLLVAVVQSNQTDGLRNFPESARKEPPPAPHRILTPDLTRALGGCGTWAMVLCRDPAWSDSRSLEERDGVWLVLESWLRRLEKNGDQAWRFLKQTKPFTHNSKTKCSFFHERKRNWTWLMSCKCLWSSQKKLKSSA